MYPHLHANNNSSIVVEFVPFYRMEPSNCQSGATHVHHSLAIINTKNISNPKKGKALLDNN